jgi:hypothetical protein
VEGFFESANVYLFVQSPDLEDVIFLQLGVFELEFLLNLKELVFDHVAEEPTLESRVNFIHDAFEILNSSFLFKDVLNVNSGAPLL